MHFEPDFAKAICIIKPGMHLAGGQRKASKRVTLEQEGSDDDDDGNGLSLKAVAQQMTAALSPHNDVDRCKSYGTIFQSLFLLCFPVFIWVEK